MFVNDWTYKKIKNYVDEIELLSKYANTHPHAVHVHCIKGKWAYLSRTMKNVGPALAPVENAINDYLIPSLFGDGAPLSNIDRRIYSLPARMSDLGIPNPCIEARIQHDNSRRMT